MAQQQPKDSGGAEGADVAGGADATATHAARDPGPSAAVAPPRLPLEESRIIIRPDGEVVIENLSEALAEVALSLDPDADLACELPPREA
jgi:hypothetical protein